MSGKCTGPGTLFKPIIGRDWGSLFWGYCAVPAWATIKTTAIKLVYLEEKLFILKYNLDDLSILELKQIT